MMHLESELFCKNFKKLRLSRGFTQESLAEAIDSTHATINRWESGKAKPNYLDFYKLMIAMGVSFEELSGAAPLEIKEQVMPSLEDAFKVVASSLGYDIKKKS